MSLLIGFLPCVRVRCGLYPQGLIVLLVWFSPLCESSLLISKLNKHLSVVDCIHTSLVFYSSSFSPLCESV